MKQGGDEFPIKGTRDCATFTKQTHSETVFTTALPTLKGIKEGRVAARCISDPHWLEHKISSDILTRFHLCSQAYLFPLMTNRTTMKERNQPSQLHALQDFVEQCKKLFQPPFPYHTTALSHNKSLTRYRKLKTPECSTNNRRNQPCWWGRANIPINPHRKCRFSPQDPCRKSLVYFTQVLYFSALSLMSFSNASLSLSTAFSWPAAKGEEDSWQWLMGNASTSPYSPLPLLFFKQNCLLCPCAVVDTKCLNRALYLNNM